MCYRRFAILSRVRTACPTNTAVRTVFFEGKLFVGHGGGGGGGCLFCVCFPCVSLCFCATRYYLEAKHLGCPERTKMGLLALSERSGSLPHAVNWNVTGVGGGVIWLLSFPSPEGGPMIEYADSGSVAEFSRRQWSTDLPRSRRPPDCIHWPSVLWGMQWNPMGYRPLQR